MHIKEINEQIDLFKLDNGLDVYIYNNPNYDSMYANYTVDFGSIDLSYELAGVAHTDPQGIAHYLEHLMFADNDKDFFDTFSENGASANAYTSFSQTSYIFSATDNYKLNLKTLIEMTQSLNLTSGRVEDEFGVIKEEIEMYNSRPNFVLQNKLFENLCVTNYQNDIAGTIQSISEITLDDIKRLFNLFYNPTNATLFIAGNFEFDIISFVEECQIINEKVVGLKHKRQKELCKVNKEHDVVESNVAENSQMMFGLKLPLASNMREAIIDDISFEILSQWIASDLNPDYIDHINNDILNETFSGYNMLETNINILVFKMQGDNYQQVLDYIIEQIDNLAVDDIEVFLHKKIGSEIKLFSYPRQVVEFGLDLILRDFDMSEYFSLLYTIEAEEIVENIKSKKQQMVSTTVEIKPKGAEDAYRNN